MTSYFQFHIPIKHIVCKSFIWHLYQLIPHANLRTCLSPPTGKELKYQILHVLLYLCMSTSDGSSSPPESAGCKPYTTSFNTFQTTPTCNRTQTDCILTLPDVHRLSGRD